MKKIIIALVAAMVATAPAYAGNKHKHGYPPPPPGDTHTYNYNYNYNYKYKNDNNYNGWEVGAGILGGLLLGGALNNGYGYGGPPPMAPECVVQPYKVWDDYQGWIIQYRQICN